MWRAYAIAVYVITGTLLITAIIIGSGLLAWYSVATALCGLSGTIMWRAKKARGE